MGSAGGQGQASILGRLGQRRGCPDKVILGVGPGWVVMNLLVTLEAHGEEVLCVDKLFAGSSGLMVNL